MFALGSCFAQFPILDEKFDGDVSNEFVKNVQVDAARTIEEKVDTGNGESGALVMDFSDKRQNYPLMLRIPKGHGAIDVGKNIYRISFNYKILSLHAGDDLLNDCVAAIQQNVKGDIYTHSAIYFGRKVGEKGKIELYSSPTFEPIYFFLSPKNSGAKIAIDNFKIEKLKPFPDWMYDKKLLWGMKVYPFNPNFYSQNPNLSSMSKEQFFPFVDKFGQYRHKEWPNKIHSIEDFKARIAQESDYNAKTPDIANRDKYFGWINPKYKFKATGKFRTQKVNGKWFLVTPEGNLFWSMGVNTVGLYAPTPISGREHFFEDISGEKYTANSNQTRLLFKKPHKVFHFEHRNMDWKYGENWRDNYWRIVDVRARKWGINTLGCWAQGFVIKNSSVPYMCTAGSGKSCKIKTKYKLTAYWIDVPDYFYPNFREDTKRSISYITNILKDPRCIGAFIDNELPWQPKSLMLGRGIIQSVPEQPAKLKFMELLKNKYTTIEALNAAWKSKYSDWDDFLKTDSFLPTTKAAEADMLAIEDLYYREYFSACRDAVKAVCPDALYLGCRFGGSWYNNELMKVAAEYADIVSYNCYTNFVSNLKNPDGAVDKPIIIGEYHFGNQDRGVFGGGLRPRKTMADRIASNNAYIESALKNPHVVGAHWFRWADQVTSGRDNDGENYSCGLVDICDTPVYDFVDSVRKLSENMYDIRINSKVK